MIESLSHARPSEALLANNLRALEVAQPGLHVRVHWPVEGDHLSPDDQGRWTYRYRRSSWKLALDAQAVEQALSKIDLESSDDCLVFGLGLGELLIRALEDSRAHHIIAWDRDPWVLRQILSLHDWSEAIASGRLRFALGADLVRVSAVLPRSRTVEHPLLTKVYGNERHLIGDELLEKRALVCVGELFVDSLVDSLRAEGFSVFSFDVQRLAIEELEYTVKTFGPQVVVGINYVNGLPEFCEALGLDYVVWEIDPATDALQPMTAPAPHTHVFTYRQKNVGAFERAGFAHVSYLPLAADPERRRPMELTSEDGERYAAPVSFVGSSLMSNAVSCQQAFFDQVERLGSFTKEQAEQAADEILAIQSTDFTRFSVPELLENALPGLRGACLQGAMQDPVILLGELAAEQKRARYVESLLDDGIQVWGDSGWEEVVGEAYRGSALHETEVPLIYNGTTINVDVGRLYQDDIVTMRIFDVLACGGFVLAEHSKALTELFEVGVEVESYRDLGELKAKVEHYLANPQEARRIAERGREAVLARHTISSRLRVMLESLATNTSG